MKKFTVFTIALCLSLFTFSSALADSANPPKIISLQQVTSGPYKPGDLIKFMVGTQGGYPGLKRIVIIAECVEGLNWNVVSGENQGYFGGGLVTGYLSNSCSDGIHKVTQISVTDQTDLTAISDGTSPDLGLSVLSYEVKHPIIEPLPGQVAKPLLPDFITLSKFPTTYAGKKFSYALPRFSNAGQMIRWILQISGKNTCNIKREFQGDLAGTFEITNKGTCIIGAQPIPLSKVYSVPSLKTNWSAYGSKTAAMFIKMVVK